MEVIKYPNEKLREISLDVKLPLSYDDKVILDEMYRFVKNPNNKAFGLSAVQVGYTRRMCAIKYNDTAYKLVNPRIIWHSTAKTFDTEGCLSVIPDRDCSVPRWTEIKVTAYDSLSNRVIIINAKGLLARIIQHEIDHMDGKLYIDYAKDGE